MEEEAGEISNVWLILGCDTLTLLLRFQCIFNFNISVPTGCLKNRIEQCHESASLMQLYKSRQIPVYAGFRLN